MRLAGWLADPRTHLTGLAVFLGSCCFYPDLAQVAGAAEARAVGTIDRFGHDALVALGYETCVGHLADDDPGADIEPCFAAELASALPRF